MTPPRQPEHSDHIDPARHLRLTVDDEDEGEDSQKGSGTFRQDARTSVATEKMQLEPAISKPVELHGAPSARYGTSELPKRTICICADDFGLHMGVNQAAVNLAREHRISAVSCLVDGPAWQSGWDALKAHAASVEVGLHLNLTEDLGQNAILYSLPKLILLAYARGLSRDSLRRDIQRQFERFEATTGRMPDFVDGHQHVHQLPMIRNALMDVLDRRYSGRKPWLRATYPPARSEDVILPVAIRFKSTMIARLGASALSRLARTHGYSQNLHLMGVYGFEMSERHYLHNLRAWLTSAKSGDVLMCHPSLTGPWKDPLLGARYHEYRVLSGDVYTTLAECAGIRIGTLPFRVT